MKLTRSDGLIFGLGATAALPLSLPLPDGAAANLPADLLVWPILVAILVWTGDRDWKPLLKDPVARLLAAFLVVTALSVPIGLVTYHTSDGVRSWVYQAVILANFAAGCLVMRSLKDVRTLVTGYVISAGLVAMVLDAYLLQSGVISSAHSIHNSRLISTVVYGWPNAFSVLVAAALILGVYLFLTAETVLTRRLYMVLAAALGLCELLSFSKTGWVALAVALWLVFLRFWSLRDQVYVLAALASVAIVLLFVTNDSFRTQVFTIETLTERVQIVADVFRYLDPVIFVVGSGSQSLQFLLSQTTAELVPGVPLSSLSPHDEFMNVLVKGGILSLLIFVVALAVVFVRTRQLVSAADHDIATFFHYWYAVLWAVGVSLLAGEELHYWPVAACFWLIAGATVRFVQAPVAAAIERTPPGKQKATPAERGRQAVV